MHSRALTEYARHTRASISSSSSRSPVVEDSAHSRSRAASDSSRPATRAETGSNSSCSPSPHQRIVQPLLADVVRPSLQDGKCQRGLVRGSHRVGNRGQITAHQLVLQGQGRGCHNHPTSAAMYVRDHRNQVADGLPGSGSCLDEGLGLVGHGGCHARRHRLLTGTMLAKSGDYDVQQLLNIPARRCRGGLSHPGRPTPAPHP